jgi:hypothetical protein
MISTIAREPDSAVTPDRDFRIDLFRGLSLWLIFLDHIPESIFNNITLRNFGFSDAAEILVFLSGLASGIVYGRVARESGPGRAAVRAFRRGVEIYLAQMVLIILYFAQVLFFARWQERYLHDANVAILQSAPGLGAFQAMILRYAPVNIDALSLMVVLHFAFAAVLPLMVRRPTAVLFGSAALYVAAHGFDWSIPAWPRGYIYFNPLDWQFLYVIAAWWALTGKKHFQSLETSRALSLACAAFLLFAFLVTLGWRYPALKWLDPQWLSDLIYPIEKSDLALVRLLHFLALAFVCWHVIPSNHAILQSRWLRPLVQCGEHSLAVFCASVLLSFAAHFILVQISDGLAAQCAVGGGGILIMSALAALLSRLDRRGTIRPRTI